MKIAIDIRPMQGETRHRGIGKALQRTLPYLSEFAHSHDDQLVFVYDRSVDTPDLSHISVPYDLKAFQSSRIRKKKFIRVLIRPFRLLNLSAQDADCVLQFDFTLGVPKKVPSVVLFHDLIPVLFREEDVKNQLKATGLKKIKQSIGSTLQWRRYSNDLLLFRQAAKILAISENSKNDLLKFDNRINQYKVDVCYLGIDRSLSSTGTHKMGSVVSNIIKEQYLLYVGGVDTRKNIKQLVKDFYTLKSNHPKLKLVVVGKEFSLKKNLAQVGWTREVDTNKTFAKDIILPGFVSDYELQLLYKKARCFVLPSRYEGFGLPVLEAMALSCPVVAYNNSSIPEVAGDAALLVASDRPTSQAIESILTNDTLREKLINKGKLRITHFPWQRTAEKIYSSLEEIANK